MWEFSLIANKFFVCEAQEILKILKAKYHKNTMCSAIVEKSDLCICAIAFDNINEVHYFKKCLKNVLCKAIYRFFKQNIIANVFNFYSINDLDLMNLVFEVDKKIDEEKLLNYIDFDGDKLFIDNMLNFKCNKMILKWEAMSEVLCQNYRLLLDENNKKTFIDLIKKRQEKN